MALVACTASFGYRPFSRVFRVQGSALSVPQSMPICAESMAVLSLSVTDILLLLSFWYISQPNKVESCPIFSFADILDKRSRLLARGLKRLSRYAGSLEASLAMVLAACGFWAFSPWVPTDNAASIARIYKRPCLKELPDLLERLIELDILGIKRNNEPG